MPTILESEITNIIDRVGGLFELPDAEYQVALRIFESSAPADIVPIGESIGEIAVDAAGAAAGTVMLAVILFIIGILVACRLIEYNMANAVSWIPLGIGKKAAAGVHLAFSPLDNLEDSCISHAESLAGYIWHRMIALSVFLINAAFPHTNYTHVSEQPVTSTNVAQSVGALEYDYQSLNTRVTHLEHLLYGSSHTPSSVTAPSASTLRTLEKDIQILWNNQIAIQTELAPVVTALNQLWSDFQTLESQLTGLRSTSVTFSDLQSTVAELQKELSATSARQGAEINTNAQHVTHLWPLTLLLEPGLKGIQTLRKLEDEPCQCPKFGGLGGDIGTALSLLEFVENG